MLRTISAAKKKNDQINRRQQLFATAGTPIFCWGAMWPQPRFASGGER